MECAYAEGPVPNFPGGHCRGLEWMFRGGPGGLGVGRQTGGPQYRVGIIGVLDSVSLAKAVSGPDCTV